MNRQKSVNKKEDPGKWVILCEFEGIHPSSLWDGRPSQDVRHSDGHSSSSLDGCPVVSGHSADWFHVHQGPYEPSNSWVFRGRTPGYFMIFVSENLDRTPFFSWVHLRWQMILFRGVSAPEVSPAQQALAPDSPSEPMVPNPNRSSHRKRQLQHRLDGCGDGWS